MNAIASIGAGIGATNISSGNAATRPTNWQVDWFLESFPHIVLPDHTVLVWVPGRGGAPSSAFTLYYQRGRRQDNGQYINAVRGYHAKNNG